VIAADRADGLEQQDVVVLLCRREDAGVQFPHVVGGQPQEPDSSQWTGASSLPLRSIQEARATRKRPESEPAVSHELRNISYAATVTRWPAAPSAWPSPAHGATSPRDPTATTSTLIA
jgi:hypothetical protein